MLTNNEIKLLRYLIFDCNNDRSINEIAKNNSLSPGGALKILKKWEKINVLRKKKISNLYSYKPNPESDKARLIFELALMEELPKNLSDISNDLKSIKDITKICIILGAKAKKPNNTMLLAVIDAADIKKYRKNSSILAALGIKDIQQTDTEFKKSIVEQNSVVMDFLRYGKVLSGQKELVSLLIKI